MKQLLLLLSIVTLTAGAQQPHQCGTGMAMEARYRQRPELRAERQKRNATWQAQAQNRTSSVTATYVIPVVIHILHQNGPENISDAQARDALRIMNLDYSRTNADFGDVIPDFQSVADSTKIQFVLATRDPDGNCTTGILHHEDPDTDWNDQSITLFSYTWDPTRYMNVYVVRSITMSNGFQAAGYAYYPGSWPDGFPYDAMVMLHNYFGTIGTGDPFLTRVLTHETGHWLDLAHVFGDQPVGQDCFGDDYVVDTPPTAGFGSCPDPSNPATYQLCTAGVSENFQNFMDYSYCTRMFTQGQAQRMQSCLQSNIAQRSNLWSYQNLLATGVINPAGPCAPIADFSVSRRRVCVNAPVIFSDNSSGGPASTYAWSFNGATPATSSSSVQSVTYATPGFYNASLSVSNAAGNSAKNKSNVVRVISSTASYGGTWTEGFENATTVAQDWVMECKNGVAYWERTTSAAATGNTSIRIDRLSNTRKNRSSMTSPLIDISALTSPALNFKVASAESYPDHKNNLRVYLSSDCGQTWSTIYSKITPQLITSASTASNFVPTAQDWRSETVSLVPFAGSSGLMFRYEYIRDTLPQTNHIYIDNINITGVLGVDHPAAGLARLSAYPVPASSALTVNFDLTADARVEVLLLDLLGRETGVAEGAFYSAGSHHLVFDGIGKLSAGLYILKAMVNGEAVTQKVLVEH